MNPLNWGLSTHLFVYQPISAEVLDAINNMGIHQIELWGMRPHFEYADSLVVADLKSELIRRNMRVYAVHAPFYVHVEQLKLGRELSLCSDDPDQRGKALQHIGLVAERMPGLGAGRLILHVGGLHDEYSPQSIGLFKEHVLKLLPLLERLDLTLALENIATPLSSISNLIDIIEDINSPRLGICLDIGHANLTGNPLEAISRCAEHLFAVHISDNNGQTDQHLVPGEGNIPWQKVFRKLEEAGFSGPLTLELRQYGEWPEFREKIIRCIQNPNPFSSL